MVHLTHAKPLRPLKQIVRLRRMLFLVHTVHSAVYYYMHNSIVCRELPFFTPVSCLSLQRHVVETEIAVFLTALASWVTLSLRHSSWSQWINLSDSSGESTSQPERSSLNLMFNVSCEQFSSHYCTTCPNVNIINMHPSY